MIPPFDQHGNLPPGVHPTTPEEVEARFGSGSPEREVETQELLLLIEWARRAGIRRLIINGSYTSAAQAPNDVDLVILPGPDYPRDQRPASDEGLTWPFLHVLVAADDSDLETWATRDFGTDRELRPKGVVEVIL